MSDTAGGKLSPIEKIRAKHPNPDGWKATGEGVWQVKCPAHDDGTASLTITDRRGTLLLHCHAGCTVPDIMESLGLQMADLFSGESKPAKQQRRKVATYDYTHINGALLYQQVRYDPKDFRSRRPDPDNLGEWIWKLGDVQRVLYNLPRIAVDSPTMPVIVVEGERDADKLTDHGLIGTTNIGGAGKWLKAYTENLRGTHVILIPDNDQPGYDHMNLVASKLQGVAASIKTVLVPGVKDLSDYAGDIGELIDKAEDWTPDSYSGDPTSLESRIEALDKDTSATTKRELLREIASADSVERHELIQTLSERTGMPKKDIREQIATHNRKAKQDTRQKLNAAVSLAMKIINTRIVLPRDSAGKVSYSGAHLIMEPDGGAEYITACFTDKRTATAPLLREFKILVREQGIDLPGDDPTGLPASARERLESAIENGKIGKQVEVQFGPYLDKKSGKLRTITDLDNGILILSGGAKDGATVIRTATAPEERPESFERVKTFLGESWMECIAHMITATVHECPSEKVLLLITGSAESGKSRKAEFMSRVVDGRPNIISPADLSKSWPQFFSTRMPTLDNLDYRTLSPEDMNVLAMQTTSKEVNVAARYTPSGLNTEGVYAIFTSIMSDVFDHYPALKSRAVQIAQSYSERAMELASDIEELADEFRPHFWYMVEKYLANRHRVHKRPGNLRIRGWARVRSWIAIEFQGMNELEADELMLNYRPQESDAHDDDPFVIALKSACESASLDKLLEKPLKPSDIVRIMKQYAPEDCRNIQVGKSGNFYDSSNAHQTVRSRIDKLRVGDKIGTLTVRNMSSANTRYKNLYMISVPDSSSAEVRGGSAEVPETSAASGDNVEADLAEESRGSGKNPNTLLNKQFPPLHLADEKGGELYSAEETEKQEKPPHEEKQSAVEQDYSQQRLPEKPPRTSAEPPQGADDENW